LHAWYLQDAVFPLYDQVQPEHVVPGMRALLGQLHKDIDALEASVTPSWEGLVEPLEKLTDKHQRTWGVVSHLKVGCGAGFVRCAASMFGGGGVFTAAKVEAGSCTKTWQLHCCTRGFSVLAVETPSWEGLVEPLEKLTDKHQRTWGVVSHLKVGCAMQFGLRCTKVWWGCGCCLVGVWLLHPHQPRSQGGDVAGMQLY
jgi:Zn-dependent oligopeptidase